MKKSYDPNTKILTLEIPGDVLSTNVQSLRAEFVSAIESDSPGQPWALLEIDLRAARMIDSAGLNLIVFVIRAVEQKSKKLRAVISNINVQRTFMFTRLDRHLEMVVVPPKN